MWTLLLVVLAAVQGPAFTPADSLYVDDIVPVFDQAMSYHLANEWNTEVKVLCLYGQVRKGPNGRYTHVSFYERVDQVVDCKGIGVALTTIDPRLQMNMVKLRLIIDARPDFSVAMAIVGYTVFYDNEGRLTRGAYIQSLSRTPPKKTVAATKVT